MTIYEKNLKMKEEGLAIFAEPIEESKQECIEIENLESKSGLLTAKVKRKDEGDAILMHSLYFPTQEAEQKVKTLDFAKNTMIVVFGFGLGHHLFELGKKISRQSKVVVIENSKEIFNNAMGKIDITQILNDPRFTFLIGLNFQQILYYFEDVLRSTNTFFQAANIQFLSLNYYDKIFPSVATDMSKEILNKILNSWHCLGNSPADTLVGFVQNFKNIEYAIDNPGIKELEGKYKDKPAIIVSAGPSLDKNVELLKEVEGKALILATDATLRGLTKRGITPDAVVSLERVLVYEQLLKNRDFELPERVVLAVPPLVQTEVFEEFEKNKKLICYKEGEPVNTWINEIIGDKGTSFMGNNVAHTAFGIALRLGANPIIFIGQDLAFSKNGDTHGKDIDDDVKKFTKIYTHPEDIVYLSDYNGSPIKSTVIWKTFLIGFENAIAENKDRTFIDATEGGARIKGTKIMTLREVIDTIISKNDINRLYEMVPSSEELVFDKKQAYYRLSESVSEKQKLFEDITNLAKECSKGINKVKKKYMNKYKTMNQLERDEVCENLLKTNSLHKQMMTDGLLILFFQGLFASIIYEVNKLGLEVTNENIWKNLKLQEDFLEVTLNISETTVKVLKMIKEYLKAQYEKYPEKVDPNEYIKFEMRFEELNPEDVKIE